MSCSASRSPGVFGGQALRCKVACLFVIDVMLLRYVCCIYKVKSNSNHRLCTELPSSSTRVRYSRVAAKLIQWSLRYQGVKRPNLQGYPPGLGSMWNDLPYTLCLPPESWTGLRVQSAVGCFYELKFFQFSVFRDADDCGVA